MIDTTIIDAITESDEFFIKKFLNASQIKRVMIKGFMIGIDAVSDEQLIEGEAQPT